MKNKKTTMERHPEWFDRKSTSGYESMTQRDNAPIQAVRVDIYGQTRRRRTYWVYLTPDGKAFLDAIDAYTHAYNNRVRGGGK